MSAVTEIAPSDPRGVPEIEAVIERHGWGSLIRGGLTAFPGRNENWAGTTTAGVQVFIKKIDGPDAPARFDRALSFTQLAHRAPDVPSPLCIAWDEPSRVLVFELLPGARSGSHLARSGSFTDVMAGDAGRIVGRLHRITVDEALDTTPPSWPRLDGLRALTVSDFVARSGAQLELFGLLQNDCRLVSAITVLGEHSRRAPAAPTHCDLRLDQFLAYNGTLHLADWEELRAEDPARDVGAFLGEWVHRCVRAIARDGAVTPETIISSGVRNLERSRPLLRAFWNGYQEAGEVTDPQLASRSAAYAGWHLLDRVLAASTERARLHALDRAGIGIARKLLCSPDDFRDALGLPASQSGARS
ncbi:class V lanthionine synthetase subunit LxmK [Streptomyces wuyuanensis]|uniref:class V lanthionine synthetase subunit LxmK n=1 Tax=Streptomyces wuyuanensis TaxID=1196353 RepID=UPI0034444A29